MKRKILIISSIIPGLCILFGCANNATSIGMLYAPSRIESSGSISKNSKAIYNNFVDVVVPNFFENFGKEDNSICLSLPDLFLCYNMMAILSESSLQEACLDELGASSMEEVANASKELIPYFCYVENDGEKDSGAFNLNGFFFDPGLELKDEADTYFKTIAESFNGYVFKSKPTTEVVDNWIRQADEEGYLADVPTPVFDENTLLTTISCYAIFDAFDDSYKSRLEQIYKEGSRRFEYTLADGSQKEVDYLRFGQENASIEKGNNYIAAMGNIDSCVITAYYPDEGVGLDELSASIFLEEERIYESYGEVYLEIPMFEVNSSLSTSTSSLVPSFSSGVGTGFFKKDENTYYDSSLGQNNKLTLDYKGFKGASITSMATDSTSIPVEVTKYTLRVDRPFIFEISRGGLPLYYGQINDPGYPQYNN